MNDNPRQARATFAAHTQTDDPVLGVLGGGQLGRMCLMAARRMGVRSVVLADHPDDPGAQVADHVVLGHDPRPETETEAERFARIRRELKQHTRHLTLEFENVSTDLLKTLADDFSISPHWNAARICQNRLREKRFLTDNGFPVGPWSAVETPPDLAVALAAIAGPWILKTADSGYDGKGQIRGGDTPEDENKGETRRLAELERAWTQLGRVPCILEQVVAFSRELSVIVARNPTSAPDTVVYPPFANSHANHILDTTVFPAPFGPVVTREAVAVAQGVARCLNLQGLLTVEMFLTENGSLFVNELAPRPHNSGHITIESCATSQFEQQTRCALGWPLGGADVLMPGAMVNLMGDLWFTGQGPPDIARALAVEPDAKIHWYGKRSARPGRKMGHITVLDPNPRTALLRARRARAALIRLPESHPERLDEGEPR